MPYTFLKPKTTNVLADTWNIVKNKWYFWLPIPLTYFFYPLIAISIIIFAMTYSQVRESFWKEFAQINGWQYQENAETQFFGSSPLLETEQGLMFKEGHGRNVANQINGMIDNRLFRLFNYQFTIGSGKSRTIYHYTVFAFKFIGSCPHIYLNNRSNSWSLEIGEKIPLPKEFEDKFSLMAPKEYEIEALEIFTPDILVKLLESDFPYDVEFVNQEIIVFADGQINDFPSLEKSFNQALVLNDLLASKLDKFKFEKIGDRTASL